MCDPKAAREKINILTHLGAWGVGHVKDIMEEVLSSAALPGPATGL